MLAVFQLFDVSFSVVLFPKRAVTITLPAAGETKVDQEKKNEHPETKDATSLPLYHTHGAIDQTTPPTMSKRQ